MEAIFTLPLICTTLPHNLTVVPNPVHGLVLYCFFHCGRYPFLPYHTRVVQYVSSHYALQQLPHQEQSNAAPQPKPTILHAHNVEMMLSLLQRDPSHHLAQFITTPNIYSVLILTPDEVNMLQQMGVLQCFVMTGSNNNNDHNNNSDHSSNNNNDHNNNNNNDHNNDNNNDHNNNSNNDNNTRSIRAQSTQTHPISPPQYMNLHKTFSRSHWSLTPTIKYSTTHVLYTLPKHLRELGVLQDPLSHLQHAHALTTSPHITTTTPTNQSDLHQSPTPTKFTSRPIPPHGDTSPSHEPHVCPHGDGILCPYCPYVQLSDGRGSLSISNGTAIPPPHAPQLSMKLYHPTHNHSVYTLWNLTTQRRVLNGVKRGVEMKQSPPQHQQQSLQPHNVPTPLSLSTSGLYSMPMNMISTAYRVSRASVKKFVVLDSVPAVSSKHYYNTAMSGDHHTDSSIGKDINVPIAQLDMVTQHVTTNTTTTNSSSTTTSSTNGNITTSCTTPHVLAAHTTFDDLSFIFGQSADGGDVISSFDHPQQQEQSQPQPLMAPPPQLPHPGVYIAQHIHGVRYANRVAINQPFQ